MTLPERMRLAADILDEAQARYLSDYPWLADELEGGWSANGLRTFAEIWERQEAASA
ncbi:MULTISPECIES: hypothetical protein [unclassified Mycobacteroides]|uniref:hypothetical protein n=1 Tax=unclassified Mycobacteroides TaxID=2618759 RepID=UPI000AA018D0|nr:MULTISPECIES: hypothetical protein [unclassified Mycobacteroides]